jgi:penicillin-binding protein 1C
MHEEGHLDRAELERELATVPHIVRRPPRPWQAARFVDRVLDGVRSGRIRPHGRELRTSLDLGLQHLVEQLLRAGVDRHRPRGVHNGAAIVVDPASGEVLAYVGAARPGPSEPGGMLDLLAARRQPGSTLKPFVYELLFERGGTPATVLDDVARPATGAGGVIFETGNYDGRERGPVRARVALASSLNLAALDAARRVGAETIVARLSALGLLGVGSAERHGAAIVLGGVDVTPLELAAAYVTLARGGSRVPLTLLPVAALPEGERVMEPAAAVLAADVLADAGARRDAFGADLVLLAGGVDLALKTGTSSGFRDAWTAAFTDRVVVVVWLGDPGGRALAGVSGFEGAAPIAARIVAAAHARIEAAEVPVAPLPLDTAPVCAESGMRPGPHCPHVVLERFEPGTAPEHRCDQHGPGGVWTLPPRYAAWVGRSRPAGQVEVRAAAPSVGAPLRIVRPENGARWLIDPRRPPVVELVAAAGDARLADVDWLVDGRPLATSRWTVTPGDHEIVAVHDGLPSPVSRVTVAQPQR